MKTKTKGVADSNTLVVASTAAMATANVMNTNAHAFGLMFENAVHRQNNDFQIGTATTTTSVKSILECKKYNKKTYIDPSVREVFAQLLEGGD